MHFPFYHMVILGFPFIYHAQPDFFPRAIRKVLRTPNSMSFGRKERRRGYRAISCVSRSAQNSSNATFLGTFFPPPVWGYTAALLLIETTWELVSKSLSSPLVCSSVRNRRTGHKGKRRRRKKEGRGCSLKANKSSSALCKACLRKSAPGSVKGFMFHSVL